MESLLQELNRIDEEHKNTFEKKNLKAHNYVLITKRPVMLKFNTALDNKHQLPKEVFEKINALIMSYYGS